MGDLLQFPLHRCRRPGREDVAYGGDRVGSEHKVQHCSACGQSTKTMQGVFAGRLLCVVCSKEERRCDWCGEVAKIGMCSSEEEICFPCWRRFLLSRHELESV